LLWNFLVSKKEEIVDREGVIAAVWPEYIRSEDLAVSDWAIDRLAARLRKKLKTRGDNYKLITLRGRGYKLVEI
jgi:DNA-binding winged helix-turn-helix (wHTH) protein